MNGAAGEVRRSAHHAQLGAWPGWLSCGSRSALRGAGHENSHRATYALNSCKAGADCSARRWNANIFPLANQIFGESDANILTCEI